jgi:hypothetical protein
MLRHSLGKVKPETSIMFRLLHFPQTIDNTLFRVALQSTAPHWQLTVVKPA